MLRPAKLPAGDTRSSKAATLMGCHQCYFSDASAFESLMLSLINEFLTSTPESINKNSVVQ